MEFDKNGIARIRRLLCNSGIVSQMLLLPATAGRAGSTRCLQRNCSPGVYRDRAQRRLSPITKG